MRIIGHRAAFLDADSVLVQGASEPGAVGVNSLADQQFISYGDNLCVHGAKFVEFGQSNGKACHSLMATENNRSKLSLPAFCAFVLHLPLNHALVYPHPRRTF
jgi:hypothetical protein